MSVEMLFCATPDTKQWAGFVYNNVTCTVYNFARPAKIATI